MLPKHRTPTHPGEILLEEFLVPFDLTQVALAEHIGVSVQRINELVRGKRGVTPQTAWLLSQALGTTPEFWVNLQTNYDLATSKPDKAVSKLQRAR
jgi:addiction module HigA family antidote